MTPSKEITLLIADDSEEMRETLKTLLTFNENIHVLGEASDGKEALEQVKKLQPDLVLMDINMGVVGTSDGIWATQEISMQYPQTGIIIISVQDEPDYMRRAMSAGARDYLVKPFDSDELFKTIEAVAEREKAKWENLPMSMTATSHGPRNAKIFSVFSTKGGVGKSFIAANLAVEVKRRTQKRVLVVDMDLQFGDIALLLNVSPKSTLAHIAESGGNLDDADFIETHISDSQSGVRVLAAPLKPEYAEVVTPEVITKVLEIVRHHYDYIIVDNVASFGPETLASLDVSDGIFLIMAPDFLSLKNVTLGLAVMDTLNYSPGKIHLVLNRVNGIASARVKDIERGLKRQISVEIPFDNELVVGSVNSGQPLIISHPHSAVSKGIAEIADIVVGDDIEEEHPQEISKSLFGKMFGKK